MGEAYRARPGEWNGDARINPVGTIHGRVGTTYEPAVPSAFDPALRSGEHESILQHHLFVRPGSASRGRRARGGTTPRRAATSPRHDLAIGTGKKGCSRKHPLFKRPGTAPRARMDRVSTSSRPGAGTPRFDPPNRSGLHGSTPPSNLYPCDLATHLDPVRAVRSACASACGRRLSHTGHPYSLSKTGSQIRRVLCS
jgi:hypothetical protein